MHAIADFQLTYGLFRRMVLESLGSRMRLARIVAVVVLALAVPMVLLAGITMQVVMVLGAGAFLLAMPELLALVGWTSQRQIMSAPFHYEIGAPGILVQTQTSRAELSWSGISKVRSGKHAWVFKHGAALVAVPRAAFGPDQQRAIDEFLTAWPDHTRPGDK